MSKMVDFQYVLLNGASVIHDYCINDSAAVDRFNRSA